MVIPEHSYGAGLAALEITGGKALAGGEFISGAQDCFRRVTAFVPDQVISRGRGETMLREELLRPEPIVLLYRAQHLSSCHVVPLHCHRVLQDRQGLHCGPAVGGGGPCAGPDASSARASGVVRCVRP